MMERSGHLRRLHSLLSRFPVVGILGPRQVGKSTLAEQYAARYAPDATFFDLENPHQASRLEDSMLTLEGLRGLIVLDEIQHAPEVFRVLRVLADRPRKPARFLVLGSASPELLRQTSESLAGRIAWHELTGFSVAETGTRDLDRLWLRGGFPLSFLATSEAASMSWRREFIRSFLVRDLPQLGIRIPAETTRRFWNMLAHYHGQTWNASEFGRALGTSDVAARHHLDLMCSTFVVRRLSPWHENISKRQVKSPKTYIADTGLLHAMLNLSTIEDVASHPKVGASWEGFALAETADCLRARPEECYFWATQSGAELDLVVVRGRRRRGFEFKRTSTPRVTPSMRTALEDLRLDSLDVVYSGDETYPLASNVRAVGIKRLRKDVKPFDARTL